MGIYKIVQRFDEAVTCLGKSIGNILLDLPEKLKEEVQEVRLRAGAPISVCTHAQIYYLQDGKAVWQIPVNGMKCLSKAEIEECFLSLCDYSVYSHQDDIKNGFITIKGGHRAGVCGTAVIDHERITSLRNISSINLRISRQVNGVSEPICREIFFDGLCSALIAGAPSSGKTTVLRDIARQLSTGCLGRVIKVSVVDERGEIAGVFRGMPQNDLGFGCDILNGYPKAEGIMHAVRCLSPDVIICDEIGGEKDVSAIESGIHSGVAFLASIHASSEADLEKKASVKKLKALSAFEKIILLNGREHPGSIKKVITLNEKQQKINQIVS